MNEMLQYALLFAGLGFLSLGVGLYNNLVKDDPWYILWYWMCGLMILAGFCTTIAVVLQRKATITYTDTKGVSHSYQNPYDVELKGNTLKFKEGNNNTVYIVNIETYRVH